MAKANKPAKPKRTRSLRWSLILLILICWVLPLMLTVTVSGVITSQRTYQHVSDIVSSSVENAVDILQRDLDGTVSSSLSISYVPTVREAYTQYQKDDNVRTFYNEVNQYLTQEYTRNPMISSAHMVFPGIESNFSYLSGNSITVYNHSVTNFVDARAFYANGGLEATLQLFPSLDTDIAFVQTDGCLYQVRLLSLLQNRFTPYAILVMEINLPELYKSLQSLPWLSDATISLNDGQATLVPFGEQVNQPSIVDTGRHHLQREGDIMLLYGSVKSERFSLQYHVRANLRPLLGEMRSSLITILLTALLIFPMVAVVLAFFYRKVTRPIAKLSGFAGHIEEGEFGIQIDTGRLGSPEFGTLGTQMNVMSARLQDQFERIYREELALRDARIKALQSQINPHFLGNTLEIINWEARLSGNVKVSAMLEALSTMLEAVLDRRHRPMVHLSEEMMYVNAYLYIIKERLGKRLTVKQEIDPALLDWYVPRLILQPIVENAVDHGIANRSRGTIIIRAVAIDDEWMQLQVINDSPLQPEDEERIKLLLSEDYDATDETSGNIGIRNVHQRLRILYGPKSGLIIENDKTKRTISSMCIHVNQEPQENAR